MEAWKTTIYRVDNEHKVVHFLKLISKPLKKDKNMVIPTVNKILQYQWNTLHIKENTFQLIRVKKHHKLKII